MARSSSSPAPKRAFTPCSGYGRFRSLPNSKPRSRRGDRKAQDWVRAHRAREVFFPAMKIGGRDVDPFFNINRPEDLSEAEALLGLSL